MNFLKSQAGITGILLELAICSASPILNLLWQIGKHLTELRSGNRFHSVSGSNSCVLPARCSAIASAASLANRSGERANDSSHRLSSSISSRIRAAIAEGRFSTNESCSLIGRVFSLTIACSVQLSHKN